MFIDNLPLQTPPAYRLYVTHNGQNHEPSVLSPNAENIVGLGCYENFDPNTPVLTPSGQSIIAKQRKRYSDFWVSSGTDFEKDKPCVQIFGNPTEPFYITHDLLPSAPYSRSNFIMDGLWLFADCVLSYSGLNSFSMVNLALGCVGGDGMYLWEDVKAAIVQNNQFIFAQAWIASQNESFALIQKDEHLNKTLQNLKQQTSLKDLFRFLNPFFVENFAHHHLPESETFLKSISLLSTSFQPIEN